jgi:hypothetical protein
VVAIALLSIASNGSAANPSAAQSAIPEKAIATATSALRELLLANLPQPLFESADQWGHQVQAIDGIKWTGKGFGVHPAPQRKGKNHGTWRHIVVTVEQPERTLAVGITDVRTSEPGRTIFRVLITCTARFEFHQENWQSGVRTYSETTRGRVHLRLALGCDVLARVETEGRFLPEAVVQVRLTSADVQFDLVFDHVLGVGGDLAKGIGASIHEFMIGAKPSAERDLLAKVSRGIQKAVGTREIHLGLESMLGIAGPAGSGTKGG